MTPLMLFMGNSMEKLLQRAGKSILAVLTQKMMDLGLNRSKLSTEGIPFSNFPLFRTKSAFYTKTRMSMHTRADTKI